MLHFTYTLIISVVLIINNNRVRIMVLNATNLLQVTDKLYHTMLYQKSVDFSKKKGSSSLKINFPFNLYTEGMIMESF
jgi:hypothetical protein